MKVVFCGTPRFAVPALKHLIAQPDFQVAAVITQPDRPSGRGMQVTFSPVKETALAAGLPVHQPEKIRAAEPRALLEQLTPDFVVIIAYGQIVAASLLSIPKLGWINLHGSLLPKYRGAAPIQWAIANGETKTGLTTMRIDAGMDTGDMLLQKEIEIGPTETTPQLAERMAVAGGPLMAETLRDIAAGQLAPQPQRHTDATYAPLLKKENGQIDWGRSAHEIYNRMRAFTPWPGAYTAFRGRLCHIVAELASNEIPRAAASHARPGTIRIVGSDVLATCGGATELRILSVKIGGGRSIAAIEYLSAARLTEGERFGEA